MISRRRFLVAGGTALAGAAGLGFYAWQIEPHWVEVVRRSMPLANLPPELAGRTLLQISDMHVGPRVSSDYLMNALTSAQALAPDFVAITGDLITYRTPREYDELARVLATLPRGRVATMAALGNHDYGFGWRHIEVADRITRVAEEAGIVVLRNEVRTLGGLQVAGLGDLWGPEFRGSETLASLAPSVPTVVLAHNPDAQDLPIWDGVTGWVLAGHTHGGQVKPPFLPPPILPVQNKRYTAGAFNVGPGRTLYINRGLGHLLQVRFNVRPELTLFTLEPALEADRPKA
jgi:predicted MPP superfamily phosphohydrolase